MTNGHDHTILNLHRCLINYILMWHNTCDGSNLAKDFIIILSFLPYKPFNLLSPHMMPIEN